MRWRAEGILSHSGVGGRCYATRRHLQVARAESHVSAAQRKAGKRGSRPRALVFGAVKTICLAQIIIHLLLSDSLVSSLIYFLIRLHLFPLQA
jgi:hypothetical protein